MIIRMSRDLENVLALGGGGSVDLTLRNWCRINAT